MVEAKGTPASNKDDKSPIQVNSTAELREWCAQQRKFLVAERDTAKTPDAKLIRVGMLRMLNNMESLLIQASTTFVKQPLPTTFPRSFDELSALLLDYYDLPRTFPVMDLLNGRWRFQAIKDHPYHKGPILTLNRYAHDKDLMNAILQVFHDTFPSSGSPAVLESKPEVVPPATPPPNTSVIMPLEEEDLQEEGTSSGGRGRKTGNTFSERFVCPCGTSFKYEKAFKNHQDACPKAKKTPIKTSPPPVEGKPVKDADSTSIITPVPKSMAVPVEKRDLPEEEIRTGQSGRKAGATFAPRFTCSCGNTFKYEKAFKTHQESCPECKESGNGQRGRKQGDTFSAKFVCACGRAFKYEKAYLNHKALCQ